MDDVIPDVVCLDGLSNGDEATSIGADRSSSDESDIGTNATGDYTCAMDVANVPHAMDRDDVEYEVTPHSDGQDCHAGISA